MSAYDAVFVGSGINSLVGAAVLAKAGWKVCVFERNSWLGGSIRTAEITEPGFRHDLFSGWHPLFAGSEAYALLKTDLQARGLEYLNTEYPTASLFPDGSAAFLSTSHEKNREHFEALKPGDGIAWEEIVSAFGRKADIAFGLLGTELWSRDGVRLVLKALRRFRTQGTLEFASELLSSSREWLTGNFSSERIHGLFAPWVLHTGLGPDQAGSGFMNKLIAFALQMGGMPVPKGGGSRLAESLVQVIRDLGGECHSDTHVNKVLVKSGVAVGVRTRGADFEARRAVLCCVTPQQLYLDLLDRGVAPDWVVKSSRHFRYGRGDMQIHLALSEPPHWPGRDGRFMNTAMIHVSSGLNGVSRAVNEAERGLLPADPTVVVGQPTAVDASRAPTGKWIFWIQLQELPTHPIGDAADKLEVSRGTWTEKLREEFADRALGKLMKQIPNLDSVIRKRVVLSPADLEASNINLVGGDPYAGSCAPGQFFVLRPLPGLPHHRTPISNLYHIGASTHPGPGLHGASGLMAAKQILGVRKMRQLFSS